MKAQRLGNAPAVKAEVYREDDFE